MHVSSNAAVYPFLVNFHLYEKFALDEPELGLCLDGACGRYQAKEVEIPTNLPGSFCVRCPHNLYRLRKVIFEDRLYRHILVETRRKDLL